MSDPEEFEMVAIEPEPATLQDGSLIIFDIYEFCEALNVHGALMRGGELFVLPRDSLKSVNVESLVKKETKLSVVKREQGQ